MEDNTEEQGAGDSGAGEGEGIPEIELIIR